MIVKYQNDYFKFEQRYHNDEQQIIVRRGYLDSDGNFFPLESIKLPHHHPIIRDGILDINQFGKLKQTMRVFAIRSRHK